MKWRNNKIVGSFYIDPFLDYLKSNYQISCRPYHQFPNIIEEYRNLIWQASEHIKYEIKKLSKMSSFY